MKIEVGKSYRDGHGTKVTLIPDEREDSRYAETHPFFGDNGRSYRLDGTERSDPTERCAHDLVAEWATPDADGWIEWHGGECPVLRDSIVEVRGITGGVTEGAAKCFLWSGNASSPIVAYRLAQPAKELPVTMEEDKHAHYFHDVSHLDKIDVYRMIELLQITSPSLAHAFKKIAAAGKRGAKDQAQDVQEAIDSLERWKQMRSEDQQP